jgi:hypothetical protein
MSSIYIGNCICHAESSSLSHTQQRLAQGNRQQQQLTFLILFFFLAGLPLLYKSVLFAGLMVCVSCSPILQQHHRSRSHQSVCIIRKSAGSLWDLNLFLFIFCTLGRTFCIYFGFWEVKYLGNIYQDERVAAGRMVNAYRRSCCGYLVAVYSGATFPAPAGI